MIFLLLKILIGIKYKKFNINFFYYLFDLIIPQFIITCLNLYNIQGTYSTHLSRLRFFLSSFNKFSCF